MNELIAVLETLKYYKLVPEAKAPKFATEGSACFDLHACLHFNPIIGYDKSNQQFCLVPKKVMGDTLIHLPPKSRVLVPTGLILDIPDEYSVKLYIRSSLALRSGVQLANSVGVIDCDYVEPVFVILYNTTDEKISIVDGDRICQGELVYKVPTTLRELAIKPEQKTIRSGGFGSTGK